MAEIDTDNRAASAAPLELVLLAVGAAGSLALMFWTGRHQASVVLMALFTVWVASPFVALARAWRASDPSSGNRHRLLRQVVLAASLGSLAVYGANAVAPFSPRPAAIFLVVPAATWLLSVAVLALTARRPR